MCAFAAKLTLDQQRMSVDDVDGLRHHGFGDAAIHDATQVIALFNNLARIADGLGVEPEDFIEPWGGP